MTITPPEIPVPPVMRPFPWTQTPYTNVVPFTNRDNATYLSILENIQHWLTNDLAPYVDEVSKELIDAWQENVTQLIQAVNNNLDEQNSVIINALNELAADVNEAVEDITTEIQAAKDARDEAEDARDAAQMYAANTEALQDGAISAIVADLESQSREILDSVYATRPETVLLENADTVTAGLISDSDSETKTQLKNAFRQKGDQALNIKDFGAVGDGVTNDTTSIANAITAALAQKRALYFPAGVYVTDEAFPELNDGTLVYGDGQDVSILRYTGDATFITLEGRARVKFNNLCIHITDPVAIGIDLSNCFRCTWTDCRIQGEYDSVAKRPTHANQIGIRLRDNAGDNTFLNCDVLNFGIGYYVASIQNFVIGGKVGTCMTGFYGVADGNSGMSIDAIDMVSAIGVSQYNIHIAGAANRWWITNTWMEGAENGILVGDSGSGPMQLGIVNVICAASVIGVSIQGGRRPFLCNVQVNVNPGATGMTPWVIEPGIIEGTVINCDSIVTGAGYDPLLDIVPVGWNFLGRQKSRILPIQGATFRVERTGQSSQYVEIDGGDSGLTRIRGVGKPLGLIAPNIGIGGPTVGAPSGYADMVGGVAIRNAETVPSSNPNSGGFLYAEGGALKWRGPSGTVTTIGPA